LRRQILSLVRLPVSPRPQHGDNPGHLAKGSANVGHFTKK
jgi:hypothetical protein